MFNSRKKVGKGMGTRHSFTLALSYFFSTLFQYLATDSFMSLRNIRIPNKLGSVITTIATADKVQTKVVSDTAAHKKPKTYTTLYGITEAGPSK